MKVIAYERQRNSFIALWIKMKEKKVQFILMSDAILMKHIHTLFITTTVIPQWTKIR